MNSHGSVVINHHQSCVVKMMKESAIIRTHICHITFLSTSHLIITHEKSPSNSTILNSLDQNPHQKCVYSHFIVSYTYLSYLSLYYIYIHINHHDHYITPINPQKSHLLSLLVIFFHLFSLGSRCRLDVPLRQGHAAGDLVDVVVGLGHHGSHLSGGFKINIL